MGLDENRLDTLGNLGGVHSRGGGGVEVGVFARLHPFHSLSFRFSYLAFLLLMKPDVVIVKLVALVKRLRVTGWYRGPRRGSGIRPVNM